MSRNFATKSLSRLNIISRIAFVAVVIGGMLLSLSTIGTISSAQDERPEEIGFLGAFRPSTWTFSPGTGDGSVDTSNAPASITLVGANNGGGAKNTDYSHSAPSVPTVVTYSWRYLSNDGASFDRPQILFNGAGTDLPGFNPQGSSDQSGTGSLLLSNGDTFGFRIASFDSIFGAAGVTISNFVANPNQSVTTITNVAQLAIPTLIGQSYPVNFTVAPIAGVAGGTPTGTVTVLTAQGGESCTALVSAGTCTLTSTTTGLKTIVATYNGDSNIIGSASSGTIHNVINPTPTPTPTPAPPTPTPTPTPGLEGDIVSNTGANTGGGGVAPNDVTIIQQMVLGNIPGPVSSPTNQFQRADVNLPCGNGAIDPGDATVIGQYSLGNIAPATACGLTTPIVPTIVNPIEATKEGFGPDAVGRIIRAVSTTAVAGSTVSVSIQLDSQGNEGSISYSVVFPQAVLSNPVVALGTGVPSGTTVGTNVSQVANGRLGILVSTPNSYAAGTRQMITITFNVAAGAVAGTYPISFAATPTQQSVSAATGGAILTDVTYETGNVVIGPTAAGVTISGRITTAGGQGLRNARVVLTDSEGNSRTAVTGSFGTYSFDDVEVAAVYVIGVSSKRYRFSPRVVSLRDTLTNVDFTGLE